jgi:GntR family transcriptional regulator
MLVMVDQLDPIPLYIQLADEIAAEITSRTRTPGSLLPSESYLVQEHGLARGTVRAAVRLLRDRGLVHTIGARGTYVGPPPT